jgi:hypothetical protein
MPETFYYYLQRYPEVFSWYCTLPATEASAFEQRTLSQLEAGHSVAVQLPLPVMNPYRQPSLYAGDACAYILYPPVDGFIRTLGVDITKSRPRRSYYIFVPYHCFKQCADCLETPDLRATLVRTIRVLRYLAEPVPGPYDYIGSAEKWRNCRQALVRYGIYCAEEYVCCGGSNKVLEYLKPLVRRREWHKPNWVYNEQELEHQREHLLFRSFRRYMTRIKSRTGQIFGRIPSLRGCDEDDLEYMRSEIAQREPGLLASMTNFYTRYNWNVSAHKGNFE